MVQIARPQYLLNSVNSGFNPKNTGSLLTWHFRQDALNGEIVDLMGQQIRTVQPGRCYEFDGVDDYVTCGDIGNSLTSLSCFAWIKTTASATDYVLSRYETLSNQRAFFIGVNATGVLDVFLSEDGQYANSSKIYESTTVVNDGDWHHVGFTWGSGVLKVFIDGSEAAVTKTQDDSFTEIHDSTNSFLIGAIRTGIDNFDGSIYGVQVFNNALSSSEVSRLHADLGDYDATLIGFWKCDEGGGSISYDASGNENHGEINDATLSMFHGTDIGIIKSWQNDFGYTNYGFQSGDYAQASTGIHWNIGDTIRIQTLWQDYQDSSNGTVIGSESNDNYIFGLVNDSFAIRMGGSYYSQSTGLDLSDLGTFYYDIEITRDASNDASYNVYIRDKGDFNTVLASYSVSNVGGASFGTLSMLFTSIQAGSAQRKPNGRFDYVTVTKNEAPYRNWTYVGGSEWIESVAGDNASIIISDGSTERYIPRDESDTSKDVQGRALQHTGRVKYNLDLTNSHCASFDGVDDYIDLGNPNSMQFAGSDSFTLSGWCDLSSTTNTSFAIMNFAAGGSGGFRWTAGVHRTTQFWFSNGSRTSQWQTPNDETDYRNPIHFTLTYDGSSSSGTYGVVKMYVNGEEVTVNSPSGSFYTDHSFNYSGATLKVADAISSINSFEGSIWGVGVWSKALDSSEISSLYSGEIPSESLEMYLPLAEGGGSVAYDASGNQNHGSITNATLSSFWGATQDVYHYNLTQGFSAYSGFEQAGGSRIDIDSGSINLGVNNTFNIWMKWNQNECTIVGNSGGYIFSLRPFGPYSFYAQTGSGGQAVLFSDTSMEDGKLHMVTMVREDEDFHLYIDGVFSETISEPLNGGLDTLIQHLSITGVTRTYNGLLIDTSFFDVALSPSEVAEAYNGGKLMDMSSHTQSANLIAQMRDNGDGTYTDLTGTYTPTYSGTLYPMKAPKGFSSLCVTNPSFYGHNDAETQFRQQAVAPAVKLADDNLTADFWYNSGSAYAINELGYDDLENNPDDDNGIYVDEHENNKKYNLLTFDPLLSGDEADDVNDFVNGS